MGVVTTLGEDLATFHRALLDGRSGITRLLCEDPRICARIGGDMSGFDLDAHFTRAGNRYPAQLVERARKVLRPTPLSGRLTAVASLQAYADAGLAPEAVDPTRVGHILGGHNLNMGYLTKNLETFRDEPDFIDPLLGLVGLDTDVLAVSSELLDLRGPSYTVGAACASSNVAVLAALDLLRAGRADSVLVTGAAMDVDALWLQGWVIMEALSFRSFNDAPERASRPFDARREGFVPSVGAAAVLLETADHARARGARPRAEVLGAASSSSACRTSKPNFEAQARALGAALVDAGVPPERVDYVNAHATSTPQGDAVEVAAIKAVLGARAHEIPVNSTKSMVGHCLTAASLIELVATILQMEGGEVHPTINQDEPDPALDLDFVPNRARPHRIGVAISNAFGFGGLNSCVVLGVA
jgi:3-oxoacyl-(acyl-carrier-protein) synthase